MLTYYDSQNNPVKLLKELGRGGEGAVYSCADETLVGKIYHEKIGDEKAEKLLWMAENSTPQLLKTTAWVAQILKEKPHGKTVGFLMPKIRAKEIHELYAPKSRRIHFPDATWHFLIHTATNLARAFHNLHKDGHVMGDVNQGNCVVTADGTVKLIDCDSYGIKTANKAYPCEVGVTTHIPPELQGKNLRNVTRTENHDNFGLAVTIFQLLFLGRHPFAGNYLGAEDKTLEDAIREHLFVYGKDAEKKRVVRPPGTLPLSAVSAPVAELFENAFSPENARPKPREWVEALEYLAKNLQQCLLNPGHLYYSKVTPCPWCEIENNTGLTLFPLVFSNTALSAKYEKELTSEALEKLVESYSIEAIPRTFMTLMQATYVKPAPHIITERERLNKMIWKSIGAAVVILLICYFFSFSSFIALVILTLNSLAFPDKEKEMRKKEREKFSELQLQRDYLESVFAKTTQTYGVEKQLFDIKREIKEYESLKTESAVKVASPDETIKAKTRQAERKIADMLVTLRSTSTEIRRQQQKLFAQGKDSLREFAQSKANVEHLGIEFPFPQAIMYGAVVISFFLPSFSYSENKPQTITAKSTSYSATPTTRTTIAPVSTVSVPNTSITDKEIAALSESNRKAIVGELLSRASSSISADNNLSAEISLKFALRFDKNSVEAINLLGITSYNLSKFKEALGYFENGRKLDSKKTEEFYLGMTYLQLEKYKEARDIFYKITAQNASAQGLYNLGTANMGLKDYKKAAENYNAILKISPGDTDAMYQLGICYNKTGDTEGVKQTYATLKAFDSTRASELRKIVGKSVNLDSVSTDSPSAGTGIGRGAGSGRGTGSGAGGWDEPPPPPVRR